LRTDHSGIRVRRDRRHRTSRPFWARWFRGSRASPTSTPHTRGSSRSAACCSSSCSCRPGCGRCSAAPEGVRWAHPEPGGLNKSFGR
jgi:hypothetical protein